MKIILLMLLLIGCSERENQASKAKDWIGNNITDSCAPYRAFGAMCELSIGEIRSCYVNKGRSSSAVDCKLYDEVLQMMINVNKKGNN